MLDHNHRTIGVGSRNQLTVVMVTERGVASVSIVNYLGDTVATLTPAQASTLATHLDAVAAQAEHYPRRTGRDPWSCNE